MEGEDEGEWEAWDYGLPLPCRFCFAFCFTRVLPSRNNRTREKQVLGYVKCRVILLDNKAETTTTEQVGNKFISNRQLIIVLNRVHSPFIRQLFEFPFARNAEKQLQVIQ